MGESSPSAKLPATPMSPVGSRERRRRVEALRRHREERRGRSISSAVELTYLRAAEACRTPDGGARRDGLFGEKIPLAARIIAACDTYDAIVTERPYRPARTPARARAELRSVAGAQLDPNVVEALLVELRPARRKAQRARLYSSAASRRPSPQLG